MNLILGQKLRSVNLSSFECKFELRTDVLTCEFELRTEVLKRKFEFRTDVFES